MKFFIPIGIAVLVGLCAALEKEQVVAKVQPNVIKHVGNFEPLKASVEPAYLDDYLVSLKDDVDASKLRELVAHLKKMNADEKAPNFQAHVEEDDIHEEFNMFTVKKPSAEVVEMLKAHDMIKHVERDQLAFASGMRPANLQEAVQRYLRSEKVRTESHHDDDNVATTTNDFCNEELYNWGLDRIDQRDNSLDCNYYDPDEDETEDGDSVRIYILDTGLQTDHYEFSKPNSKKRTVKNKRDYYGTGTRVNNDFNGHGTHVASTAAGFNVGVAKNANILGIKVLGDSGSGAYSTVIKGLKYVLKKKKANRDRAMVVNMSLGGGISTALNDVTNKLASKGIPVVVAAGNSAADACNASPASAADAITVAASTESGSLSSFSNYGSCVDVIAPGSSILGACSEISDGFGLADCSGGATYVSISGTSMAAPHVAGVGALYMNSLIGDFENPSPSPEEQKRAIQCTASKGYISGLPFGTPNDMVHIPQPDFDQSIIDCIHGEGN